ncbi:GGDEF domain-containing protein [Oleidesulfovibrio sp.]|uniref:GGDEF domain-containing protein n=1 Tax=Oleidesulfovibrio sp. TaxID=2909707 RepID=UPI003A897FCA
MTKKTQPGVVSHFQDRAAVHENEWATASAQPVPPSLFRLFILPALLYIFFVCFFVYLAGKEAETEALSDLDSRLKVAAMALPQMLAEDFHDRAVAPDSIGIDEELLNRERFNRFAADSGMIYVYTLVQFRDGFYFSSPTVTMEEARERRSWFFYPYDNPPAAFVKALQTNTIQYASYTDEWGKFRSVAVPMASPSGRRFLACADIEFKEVRSEIQRRQGVAGLVSLSFLALGIPFLLACRKAVNLYTEYSVAMVGRNMELKRLAERDGLTGLLNRVSFFREVDQQLLTLRQNGGQGALLMLDIDDYKDINDRHGHIFGDEVLLGIAHLLRQVARDVDVTGRFGGEELLLFVPECDADKARSIAEQLRNQVENLPFIFQGRTIRCTVSVGVVHFSTPSDLVTGYAEVADNALRQAKRLGKNQVVVLSV